MHVQRKVPDAVQSLMAAHYRLAGYLRRICDELDARSRPNITDREHSPFACPPTLPLADPDLVVETLSPHTAFKDESEKRQLYERHRAEVGEWDIVVE